MEPTGTAVVTDPTSKAAVSALGEKLRTEPDEDLMRERVPVFLPDPGSA
ncbi:MAG: hypothetical protein M5U31_06420 [Acidimicrobiia bacterium]|nr:hypothetical protein [Acidimicrobiia bacterium]